VSRQISFAHVGDLHLPPDPPDLWPRRYQHAIGWWDKASNRPNRRLPAILDEVRSADVDFVLFGGDILDFYHPEPAARIIGLCRERGLTTYFQLGNHDCESAHARYVTHDFDEAGHESCAERLCEAWHMPGPFYAFEYGGICFVVLDTSHYVKQSEGYAARFGEEQTRWFMEQIRRESPIVAFCHVPFILPTIEYRLRAVWNGNLGCVSEEANDRAIRKGIETNENILGVFSAHAHMRSEDEFGLGCQFLAPAGHDGYWRYVRIGPAAPPKSLRVSGEPYVEPMG
jgi:hypothetical protein